MQQGQRLIAVTGEDHFIKRLLTIAALDHHPISHPSNTLNRTSEPDLLLPTGSERAYVFPRTTRNDIPLGAICHIQQAVVGKKAQKETQRKGAHIRQGRRPDRRPHGQDVMTGEVIAKITGQQKIPQGQLIAIPFELRIGQPRASIPVKPQDLANKTVKTRA